MAGGEIVEYSGNPWWDALCRLCVLVRQVDPGALVENSKPEELELVVWRPPKEGLPDLKDKDINHEQSGPKDIPRHGPIYGQGPFSDGSEVRGVEDGFYVVGLVGFAPYEYRKQGWRKCRWEIRHDWDRLKGYHVNISVSGPRGTAVYAYRLSGEPKEGYADLTSALAKRSLHGFLLQAAESTHSSLCYRDTNWSVKNTIRGTRPIWISRIEDKQTGAYVDEWGDKEVNNPVNSRKTSNVGGSHLWIGCQDEDTKARAAKELWKTKYLESVRTHAHCTEDKCQAKAKLEEEVKDWKSRPAGSVLDYYYPTLDTQ